jgi:hypothetical protein
MEIIAERLNGDDKGQQPQAQALRLIEKSRLKATEKYRLAACSLLQQAYHFDSARWL